MHNLWQIQARGRDACRCDDTDVLLLLLWCEIWYYRKIEHIKHVTAPNGSWNKLVANGDRSKRLVRAIQNECFVYLPARTVNTPDIGPTVNVPISPIMMLIFAVDSMARNIWSPIISLDVGWRMKIIHTPFLFRAITINFHRLFSSDSPFPFSLFLLFD